MRRPQGSNPVLVRASALASFVVLVAFAALVLAACGGSGTAASSSPSDSPSQAGASPSTAASPTGIPLPTPTVAGTIAFPTTWGRRVYNADYDVCVVNTDGTGLKSWPEEGLPVLPALVPGREQDRLHGIGARRQRPTGALGRERGRLREGRRSPNRQRQSDDSAYSELVAGRHADRFHPSLDQGRTGGVRRRRTS